MSETILDTIVSKVTDAGIALEETKNGGYIASDSHLLFEARDYGVLVITLESPKEREAGTQRSYKVQNVNDIDGILDIAVARIGKFAKKTPKAEPKAPATKKPAVTPAPVAEPAPWTPEDTDKQKDMISQLEDVKNFLETVTQQVSQQKIDTSNLETILKEEAVVFVSRVIARLNA